MNPPGRPPQTPRLRKFLQKVGRAVPGAPGSSKRVSRVCSLLRARGALRTARPTAGALALALLCLCLGPASSRVARAQVPGPIAFSSQSVSGQFTVLSRRNAPVFRSSWDVSGNTNYLHLDPMLLPSSCERLKQVVWRTLGISAPWQGKIFLALHPASSPDEAVTVISQRFASGWQYRIELPDTVQRVRYGRALVEVILQELANRNAGARSAEVPTWLTEGMTRQVLVTSEAEVMLQTPTRAIDGINGKINFTKTDVEGHRINPLAPAHREFLSRAPLTFEELSWPTPNQLNGMEGEFYADSAQLFINELLRLRNGRACLLRMVGELSQCYNWQFAFLHAFGPYFQRPLDVEKWWALQTLQFTHQDLTHTWTEAESWDKLDRAIRSAVEIRTSTNQLPLTSEVTLQTIVKSWDYKSQSVALQSKLRELEYLRPRLSREHSALAEDYQKALQNYLAARDHTGPFALRKSAAQRQAIETALRDLGMLDTRREAFKPKDLTKPKPAPTLRASTNL